MKVRFAAAALIAFGAIAAHAAPPEPVVLAQAPSQSVQMASVEPFSQHEVNQYKKRVATRIAEANKLRLTKAGYRTITVVGYTFDRRGNVTETWIVRSSGDHRLDELAHMSFKKAMPLPPPPGPVFGADPTASLSEAFVHTIDGGYRLQTLVQ